MGNNISQMLNNRKRQADKLDTAYNSMLGNVSCGETIVKLPITSLKPFKNHPFKMYSDDKLNELAESIREVGLINPIIVRKEMFETTYQILSGHNRTKAAESIGLTEIDAIVKNIDDNDAAILVTESNLKQREKLLPSEKGFAYSMQLNAIKSQGKRSDLISVTSSNNADSMTCSQFGKRLKSVDIIAEKNDVSKNEIYRYIRLTHLIPELLNLIDEDKLQFIVGVSLSYLTHEEQGEIFKFFFEDKISKLDLKIIKVMVLKSKSKISITRDVLERLTNMQKKVKPKATFSIKRKSIEKYLDIIPDDKELERLFLEFLEGYHKQNKN